jgi:hypothetical protein
MTRYASGREKKSWLWKETVSVLANWRRSRGLIDPHPWSTCRCKQQWRTYATALRTIRISLSGELLGSVRRPGVSRIRPAIPDSFRTSPAATNGNIGGRKRRSEDRATRLATSRRRPDFDLDRLATFESLSGLPLRPAGLDYDATIETQPHVWCWHAYASVLASGQYFFLLSACGKSCGFMAPPCTLRSARSGEVSGIRVLGILKNEKFGAYPNRQNSDQGSASFLFFFLFFAN